MISVLYVDDQPELLEMGKLFLELSGQFSVDVITSAPAALLLLTRKKYDAVISDYQMPEMDGIEFLREVRTSGNTLPFILFTGRGREEVVIQALNEGADFYLQKGGDPVSQFTELAHKIRQAVQKRIAEISIRDHERREADIISFLPDATFAIDTDGRVIAWNKAMEMMTGTLASEILGKGYYEYTLPFYHERRPALIDLVLREDPDLEAKYPQLRRDGRTVIAETTCPFLYNGRGATIWFIAAALYDTKGTIIGAIESIRDVTDRKQAEVELNRKHEELNAAYNQLSAKENDLTQRMNEIVANQSALRESEEKYRALIENAGECIVIAQGEYLKFVNQRATEVTGYSKEELLSRPFLEFVHPDDRGSMIINYQYWLRGEQRNPYIFHIVRGDGKVRIVEIRAAPIIWDGAPATLNFIMDITELKTIGDSLRTNEIILTEAMDLALLANWEYDDQTRMFTFNDRFYALYGTTSDREGGYQMPADVYFREFIHTDDRDRIVNEVESGRKISDPCHVWQLEHKIIRRDGEVRHILAHVGRTTDKENHVIKIHGVNQDITERKREEDLARTTLHRLDSTISTLYAGILMVSEDGKVEHVNKAFCDLFDIHETPERLKGLTSVEVMKKILGIFVSPDEVSACIRKFITRGKPVHDYEIILRNGRVLMINYIPIIDVKGQRRGRVWHHHDITDRKRAEEALAMANRKLKLLSSITRHDISNQLVSMRVCLALLEKKQQVASLGNYFKKINFTAQNIWSIIQFANEYESIGATTPIWHDCRSLVNSAATQASLGNVEVKNEIPEKTEVFADPLIIKVFYNLMDNAVRHGKRITTIRFTIRESGQNIQVVCQDDGEGVPADEKDKIFDRGFGKNTGLGLFLSREILGITGITIHETGDPGNGARFEMTVPAGSFRQIPLRRIIPVPERLTSQRL